MDKVEQKIKELQEVLKKELSDETICVELFFNCQGYKLSINERTSEQLKANGISMRNLKGEFIR